MDEKERIRKGFKTRTELLQKRVDRIVEDELWKRDHKDVITAVKLSRQ